MKELIKNYISKAIKSAGYGVPVDFNVETPPKPGMGDFATNVAMIIAGKVKEEPREIAEKINKHLSRAKEIEKVDIAGPGFINIYLAKKIYAEKLGEILAQDSDYGRGPSKKTKVLVEYISANPTGPLHVGNARGGPIGEALANLFTFLGYQTDKEFYINDIGGQVDRFGQSIYFWHAVKDDDNLVFPEDGYKGKYIKEISAKIEKENKAEIEKIKDIDQIKALFKNEGLRHMIAQIRQDCELLGIKFDKWVSQSDFEHGGKALQVVDALKEKGATKNAEGAVWFKDSVKDEEDKESVLIKSDGMLTYFADDIAYHIDKYERGYDIAIDVWGANHSGHVERLASSLETLGFKREKISIILYQFVRLKEGGKVVKMAKREGNFVSLREVIEGGVSADAFKYFILSQNPNTPFDFDLELAADTSEKNPVYYIKYAHARICSILKKANVFTNDGEESQEISRANKSVARNDSNGGSGSDLAKADLGLLKEEAELNLVKELVIFPEILEQIKDDFQIQALPHYAYKIATLFHAFYDQQRVISKDKKLTLARLSLVLATKYVLANALAICGIDAPEHMEKKGSK